jgi:hypothetical protein
MYCYKLIYRDKIPVLGVGIIGHHVITQIVYVHATSVGAALETKKDYDVVSIIHVGPSIVAP